MSLPSCPLGYAQTNLGTITGTITDPAGAVVPNAPVEAKNAATGAVYPAASSATGNYTISQLPLGTYELSVTVPGFKKYVRTGITVEAYGIYRIDPVLEVGAATESVVVAAESPMLKTESTEVSYDIPTQSLDDLPILTLGRRACRFREQQRAGKYQEPAGRAPTDAGHRFRNRQHPARERHAFQLADHQR